MFDAPEFIEESIEQMKATIDDIAIIACSGGVDSTVAAVIANKAVGDLLHCVYVDTGFMRKNETEEIERMLSEQGINLVTVKAADRYFEALQGVTEPEEKRKVIGELFIRIFEDEQKKCGAKYLVQGTIAPDWIESGGGVRDTIKSHHNVGGLPEDMTLRGCRTSTRLCTRMKSVNSQENSRSSLQSVNPSRVLALLYELLENSLLSV